MRITRLTRLTVFVVVLSTYPVLADNPPDFSAYNTPPTLKTKQMEPLAWFDDPFYQNNKPPKVTLQIAQARDARVLRQLNIPAILALLKFELVTGTWSELSNQDRQRFIAILDDPNLVFTYTGKQSLKVHSSGLQTIDANHVLINQEGLFSTAQGAAPRTPYNIAQHLFHELGHVYQRRHTYLSEYNPFHERWPTSLEKQLASTHFTPDKVAQVARYLHTLSE